MHPIRDFASRSRVPAPWGRLGFGLRSEGADLAAFEVANVGQEDEPPAARIFVGATTQRDSGFALKPKFLKRLPNNSHEVA